VLATANGQESDERDLHTRERAERIPRAVADIESGTIATHTNQNEGVQREQIRDEDVSTPCRHHVSVKQRGHGAPKHRSILNGLDPKEEGEDQQENRNSLVVITARNRTRDVTRGNAHERGGKEPSGGRRDHLIGQKVGRERGKTRETGCKEDTDVSYVDRESEETEGVIDDAAGYHQSGVEGTASNSSERMPCPCSTKSAS
jgi:hypothetical protein